MFFFQYFDHLSQFWTVLKQTNFSCPSPAHMKGWKASRISQVKRRLIQRVSGMTVCGCERISWKVEADMINFLCEFKCI